ncbi:hypothetical protein RRG08_016585 [Elysia crispata]|uniref:C-type lectin domain-containing protein n=1 Tax=Elysia crispata TaxID=231223 RepID=A0AAE0YB14_9GAST|nr:hypothetical protein RRG08_016585 [Elysia crispata]
MLYSRATHKFWWTEAKVFCKRLGADLLEILGSEENNYIFELFKSNQEFASIGLHREKSQENFSWLNAGKEQYRNWGYLPEQDEDKNCAVMSFKGQYSSQWINVHCRTPFGYICEQDQGCSILQYGPNCQNRCSRQCGGPKHGCNDTNGSCLSGCNPGYQGDKCDRACDKGTYGLNCLRSCSPGCKGPDNACNHVNGSCVFGCHDGYLEERCDKEASTLSGFVRFITIALVVCLTVIVGIGIFTLTLKQMRESDGENSQIQRIWDSVANYLRPGSGNA